MLLLFSCKSCHTLNKITLTLKIKYNTCRMHVSSMSGLLQGVRVDLGEVAQGDIATGLLDEHLAPAREGLEEVQAVHAVIARVPERVLVATELVGVGVVLGVGHDLRPVGLGGVDAHGDADLLRGLGHLPSKKNKADHVRYFRRILLGFINKKREWVKYNNLT